ncbi:MAG: 5'-methylthioadenosine/adenosylhomocysteine nucleosidase [Thermoanaerobacteraceae bacterium]
MSEIGIIGAMEEEVDILKKLFTSYEIKKIAGLDFYTGFIKNKNVTIVRSGIGKVNAAMATQILISEFHTKIIINTGVAGGIKPDIKIGDIVIASDALEYDFDVTAFGYELGIIPRMEDSIFRADEKIIELVKKAADQDTKNNVFIGRIISGDKFVSSKEDAKKLGEIFKAYAVEMEGAAIAHVAYLNNVPFAIIRSISDNANDEAFVDFDSFVKKAAEVSSNIVEKLIQVM